MNTRATPPDAILGAHASMSTQGALFNRPISQKDRNTLAFFNDDTSLNLLLSMTVVDKVYIRLLLSMTVEKFVLASLTIELSKKMKEEQAVKEMMETGTPYIDRIK